MCVSFAFFCRNKRLVDAAVEHVLKQRRTDAIPSAGGLTLIDIFYREVTLVADLIYFVG